MCLVLPAVVSRLLMPCIPSCVAVYLCALVAMVVVDPCTYALVPA